MQSGQVSLRKKTEYDIMRRKEEVGVGIHTHLPSRIIPTFLAGNLDTRAQSHIPLKCVCNVQ